MLDFSHGGSTGKSGVHMHYKSVSSPDQTFCVCLETVPKIGYGHFSLGKLGLWWSHDLDVNSIIC